MTRKEQVQSMVAIHCGHTDSIRAKSFAGHHGINETYTRVKRNLYWQGMSDDVKTFVSTCKTCQGIKVSKAQKAAKTLHPVPIPRKQWQQIGVDLMGPFKENKDGFKYVCTAVDYFTKFVEIVPMKDKKAVTVARALYTIMSHHGVANIHITDQGREFVNEISECLTKDTGVHHRITSAYHPQANGLVERQNRHTTSIIRKAIEREEDWYDCLTAIQWTNNSSRKEAIGMSPFELMRRVR